MALESLPRFEDTDFWLDIKDISIGPEIGKGQFSTVHVGKYFGDLVAVKKQIRKETMLEAYILRELSVLKVAKHDNIVTYIGAYNQVSKEEDEFSASYIVTELCHGGDLLRVLLDMNTLIAWKTRLRIAKQAADAINFLHKRNLIHRDIKSSNVLLDEHWNCKITDFGMARLVHDSNDHSSLSPRRDIYKRMTICGTEEYMAPEMMFDEEYNFSVDIFSFGMVLFEILKRQHVGENGFLVRRPHTKFEIDMEVVRACMPSDIPDSLFTLAEQCCAYEPSSRPESEEVLDWLLDLYETWALDDELLEVQEGPPSLLTSPIPAASAALLNIANSESNNSPQVQSANEMKNEGSDTISAMPTFAVSPITPSAMGTSSAATPNSVPPKDRPKLVSRRSMLVSRAVLEMEGTTPPVSNKEHCGRVSFANASNSNSGGSNNSNRPSLSTPRNSFLSNLLQEPISEDNDSTDNGCRDGLFGASSLNEDNKHHNFRNKLLVTAASANLKSVEEELYKRYGLIEDHNSDNTGLLDPHEIAALTERKAALIKEGYLNRRNESGFRTWKKLWCKLTETKLIWKSTSETKRCHFDLKDTTIKYTPNRYHRFSLVQLIRIPADQKESTDQVMSSHSTDLLSSSKDHSPGATDNSNPNTAHGLSNNSNTGGFGFGGLFNATSVLGMTPVANNHKSQQNDQSDMKKSRRTSLGRNNSRNGRKSATTFNMREGNGKDNKTQDSSSSSSMVQVYQREFAAENATALEEWLSAIQDAINEEKEEDWTEFTHPFSPTSQKQRQSSAAEILNGDEDISEMASTLESPGSMKRIVSFINHKSVFEFDCIDDWLVTIGLPKELVVKYSRMFKEKGYGNPALIGRTGLQEEDFEYLGIKNPSHCRLMQNSISSYYTPTIRLAINGWTRFDNFLVFKVVSRWQCNRSSIYLKLAHFKKLDKMIRRELDGGPYSDLLNLVPILPFKALGKYESGELSYDFYSGLRRKLETYLLCVADVLNDTPKLFLLLRFLDLIAAVHVSRDN